MINSPRRRQVGFTIIEALVSLVIMGFGILAMAGMQAGLSRNADDAKQRTEAIRLAQEKIEFFRSFTGIDSTVVGQGTTSATALNWNALAGSADSITTNAVYTRTWTIGGSASDSLRGLTVNVAWADRTGAAQAVSLSSVLSKTNPADSGFLGFPLPLNTNLKRPKDRNLDIPIPAINLGNGESAVKFGTEGKYVVFNNISGDVVKICTPVLNGATASSAVIAAITSTDTSIRNCTEINGYIVAGYVSRDSSVSDADWNAVKNGLGIDYSLVTRNAAGAQGISCQFGAAVNQNTGAFILGYQYYLCVVPLATPNNNGPYTWSGTVRIAGPALWNGTGNKYFVCRYEYTATNSLTDANQRNVQPYQAVNKSIDQQNYVIATTNNATDGATPTCPASMTIAGLSTGQLHQDCRSASNQAHTTTCPLLGAMTQHRITYNSNNSSSGTVPVDNNPYNPGSLVTLLGNTGQLAKSGLAFSGWNTAADGIGIAYAAGSALIISANTTLYARWTSQPAYRTTYAGNGNDAGNVPTDTNSPYTSSSVVTVLGNTGLLTKNGYTFNGWNTAADGTGTAYAGGSFLTIANSDTTLHAQWYQPTYTVIYNGNSNTSGAVPTDATLYASNARVTVAGAGTLAKANSTFTEWNTEINGTGTRYTAGTNFAITANTRLYAQWGSLTLATPAPGWTNQTLSWPAVSNATAYLVSSCTSNGTNGLVICAPTGLVSQTGLSITLSLNNKDTRCYTIIATGPLPYVQSAQSSRRCIDLQGNNYSYQ